MKSNFNAYLFIVWRGCHVVSVSESCVNNAYHLYEINYVLIETRKN